MSLQDENCYSQEIKEAETYTASEIQNLMDLPL